LIRNMKSIYGGKRLAGQIGLIEFWWMMKIFLFFQIFKLIT